AEDVLERRAHAPHERLERLALGRRQRSLPPRQVGIGVGAHEVGGAEAHPSPQVRLPEAPVADDFRVAERRGRLRGAQEVGPEHRRGAERAHYRRQRPRLVEAAGRERDVLLALQAALAVPRGLAVAHEEQPRHASRSPPTPSAAAGRGGSSRWAVAPSGAAGRWSVTAVSRWPRWKPVTTYRPAIGVTSARSIGSVPASGSATTSSSSGR